MSCDTCGRSSCSITFHSLEEQKIYNDIVYNLKESIRSKIYDVISRRVDGEWFRWNDCERYFVELDDVLKAINEIDI